MNRLIVFESIHQAIRAEQLLLRAGLQVELVPTPREISASCGQSIRYLEVDSEIIQGLLERENVRFQGIYSKTPGHRIYELGFFG